MLPSFALEVRRLASTAYVGAGMYRRVIVIELPTTRFHLAFLQLTAYTRPTVRAFWKKIVRSAVLVLASVLGTV